jgi:hypothetical protein
MPHRHPSTYGQPPALTHEGVSRYLDACRNESTIRPGLISNPMARQNWRSVGHDRLVGLMPDPHTCISTPSLGHLHEALHTLIFERGCNVLAVNGGDGTIHHTINVAMQVVAAAEEETGEVVPLPTFLFVNGGGMNMLARAFKTRGHPVLTMRRFLKQARGRRLGNLPCQDVPLLQITEPDGKRRYGFIFGSELVLNALTMYERFGQGYRGLSRLIFEVSRGHLFNTELWRAHAHLLEPPSTALEVDEVVFPSYGCAVASTIPMTLARGLIVSVKRASSVGRMHAIAVLEQDIGRLIRSLPRLMRAAEGPAIRQIESVGRLVVQGPYTIDGELIARMDQSKGTRVEVDGVDRSIRGVWLG